MRLRVLMYHSVSGNNVSDDLTVSKEQLEDHFGYLKQKGYTSISLEELVAFHREAIPLPEKPVLISFDDGFADNFEHAYPLALKYGMKMNIFLVPHFMNMGRYRGAECMNSGQILKMDPAVVQFGLHSFSHQAYGSLTPVEIEADVRQSKQYLANSGITFQPCLAYPYGDFPRKDKVRRKEMFDQMENHGIQLAFRIGNRLNRLPLLQPYLVQRIDVRGNESFGTFKRAVRFGKKWL